MDGVLTIPAGVDLVLEVKAWGAGGGTEAARNNRHGGGGGAYFNATYSVTTGASFPIVVGQGAVAMAGGNTSFDFDGGGSEVVGGGGLGGGGNASNIGQGGTGPAGSVPGGNGGNRETTVGGNGGGGGGGGSGPGNSDGGVGGGGMGGVGGMAGSPGAAGGVGGDSGALGTDGAFPGGGAGGKGGTTGIEPGAAGGNGQVIVCVTEVTILPVELVSFNAIAKDNHILLEWQTVSETNNKGFEVQKSSDGTRWNMIEFISGNGTSNDLNTYTFIDKLPNQGVNYYRFKQLDFDGKFEYSKTISFDFNRQNEIGIFPNPVKDQLTLINGVGKATIYNVLGEKVKHLTIDANQTTIPIELLNGQYYLQVLQELSLIHI